MNSTRHCSDIQWSRFSLSCSVVAPFKELCTPDFIIETVINIYGTFPPVMAGYKLTDQYYNRLSQEIF